jgi:hypothetical protein
MAEAQQALLAGYDNNEGVCIDTGIHPAEGRRTGANT